MTEYFFSLNDALKPLATGCTVFCNDNGVTNQIRSLGFNAVKSVNDCMTAVVCGAINQTSQAKLLRNLKGKLILYPSSDLTACALPVAYKIRDGFASLYHSLSPNGVIFDGDVLKNNICDIAGEFLSLDFCAYEAYFYARLQGKEPPIEYLNKLGDLTEDAINAIMPISKNKAELTKIIPQYAVKFSELVVNSDFICQSACFQVYEALRMLYATENRPMPSRNISSFLLCGVLIDFYLKMLTAPVPIIPRFPPNNNKRIDYVSEYFGVDLKLATIYNSPTPSFKKIDIAVYRLNEFKSEFISILLRVKNRYAKSLKVFKRLFRDDGYSLASAFDCQDVAICLALAPDVFEAGSTLSFLKHTGALEYLLP